jgi:hypothetical protein
MSEAVGSATAYLPYRPQRGRTKGRHTPGDDPIDFNDPTGLDFGIPGLGTIGEYESYGNFPGAAEGFYGSGYGYGGVEVGLGIALPGIGVGVPGNDIFKGSRMANVDGPNVNPVQVWFLCLSKPLSNRYRRRV